MTDKTPELSDASVLILLKEHARLKTECDRQRIAIEELKKEIESIKAKYASVKKKADEYNVNKEELERIKRENEYLSRDVEEERARSFERLIEEIRKAEKREEFDRYRVDPYCQRNY